MNDESVKPTKPLNGAFVNVLYIFLAMDIYKTKTNMMNVVIIAANSQAVLKI